MPLRSRRIERQREEKNKREGDKKSEAKEGCFFTTRRRPLGCWVVGWLVVVVVFFFFLFSLCDLNLLFVESDKIVVKKRQRKTNFFAWKFQKKNNPQNYLTKEEERPLRAAHKERERERERRGRWWLHLLSV